ncbi:MAG TPA: efflux transporter outer membrane subunit [Opitutaceae bacterium]|nr:efflux transporter outer membrane subunit [Opitutaceae bacterium]
MNPRPRIAGGTTALLLLLALGLAPGCSLAPKYARPSLPVPATYKEASPGVAWAPAAPADAAARGRWWTLYQDERLDTLEDKLDGANQTIAAAAASFRAARATALAARSALFPVLSTNPSIVRMRNSQNWTSTNNAGTITNEYSFPVDASYELDLWRRLGNTAKAGALEAEASAADLATARLAMQAELAQDYFTVRALDAQQSILDQAVASYRDALKATQVLAHSGIDSDEDVARAQSQLESAVAQDTDLKASRALFEHAVAVLVGTSPADFSLPPAPLEAPPPAVPAGVPSDLLQRRPDIAAAERRVAAANAGIGVARTAYFPSLILGATGGWQATGTAKWFDWPSRFWSVGPALGATLFDWGARRAVTEEAQAAFDQATANYRQTVLSAFASVEDNLAALRVLQEEAGEEHAAVDASRHLLDLATTRFRLGIDSYLNVVTAQTALLSSQEAEVQIRLRWVTASVSLVKALGGGWDATRG